MVSIRKAVLISISMASALACAPNTGPKWQGTGGVVNSETVTVIVDGKATRVRVVR